MNSLFYKKTYIIIDDIISCINNSNKDDLLVAYNDFISLVTHNENSFNHIDLLKDNILFLILSCSKELNTDSVINTHIKYVLLVKKSKSRSKIIALGKDCLIEFSNSNYIKLSNNSNINKIISIIRNNLNEDLSLDFIADKVYLSKNYISTLFSKNMNITFSEFVNKIKIAKAKELLESTDYSLEYISYLCGFNSQNYFSTVFKKIEHETPINYRKKMLKVS